MASHVNKRQSNGDLGMYVTFQIHVQKLCVYTLNTECCYLLSALTLWCNDVIVKSAYFAWIASMLDVVVISTCTLFSHKNVFTATSLYIMDFKL